MLDQIKKYLPWGLSLFIAAVFVTAALGDKFPGSPTSVHIFQTIENWSGLPFEPLGRYAVASAELTAAALLIVPATQALGAVLTFGIISGAIFFHLFTPLGVVVQVPGEAGDGGGLFITAVLIWLSSVTIMWLRQDRLKEIVGTLRPAEG